MKFHKSITFKLTFWYALVTFVSSIFVLFAVNFVYLRFVNRTLEDVLPPHIRQQFLELERDSQGNLQFRDILKEIRNNDVKQVQKISLIVITGNLIIAMSGGYLLAQQMLKPIKHINGEISEIEAGNLDKKIDLSGSGDEIEELIENFNNMTERLYKSFKEQGEFVANAAHELKTPLAIMQTNVETALLDRSILKDNRDYLQNVIKTIERTNQLLENLLLLSSIQARSSDFKKTNINELIKDTINDIKSLTKEKHIKIVYSNDKVKPVYCHPVLLCRAIGNILENAIKYSPEGSSIEVNLTSIESYLLISVMDEGEGIPEQQVDKIFDRFYRVDSSRSRKTGGSGLGLAIVKEIVHLHKGEVWVEKNSDKGSKFVIKIPLVGVQGGR